MIIVWIFSWYLGSLGNIDKNLGKKVIINLAIPLARDNLPVLVSNLASNATSNVIDKFGRTISGKGAVRARREFTLFILFTILLKS